jgi:hypothetical protein
VPGYFNLYFIGIGALNLNLGTAAQGLEYITDVHDQLDHMQALIMDSKG